MPASVDKLSALTDIEDDLLNLIKSNSAMSIEGQINIIKEIESNLHHYNKLMRWHYLPTYEELSLLIEMSWHNLLKKGESKGIIVSPDQLIFYTNKYLRVKSIPVMIKEFTIIAFALINMV